MWTNTKKCGYVSYETRSFTKLVRGGTESGNFVTGQRNSKKSNEKIVKAKLLFCVCFINGQVNAADELNHLQDGHLVPVSATMITSLLGGVGWRETHPLTLKLYSLKFDSITNWFNALLARWQYDWLELVAWHAPSIIMLYFRVELLLNSELGQDRSCHLIWSRVPTYSNLN